MYTTHTHTHHIEWSYTIEQVAALHLSGQQMAVYTHMNPSRTQCVGIGKHHFDFAITNCAFRNKFPVPTKL